MLEMIMTSACADCHSMVEDVIFDGRYVSVDDGFSPAAVTGLVDAVMGGLMLSPVGGPARFADGGECWLCGCLEAECALDLYEYPTLSAADRDRLGLPTLVEVASLLEHDCYPSGDIVQAASVYEPS